MLVSGVQFNIGKTEIKYRKYLTLRQIFLTALVMVSYGVQRFRFKFKNIYEKTEVMESNEAAENDTRVHALSAGRQKISYETLWSKNVVGVSHGAVYFTLIYIFCCT